MMNSQKPSFAIIDPNTISVLGLRGLLQQVMPFVQIDCYGTISELMANNPDHYVHYFVSVNIVLANRDFFLQRGRRTIVLTTSTEASMQLREFNSICVNVPESELMRSFIKLSQKGHAHGRNIPSEVYNPNQAQLSPRELEVLVLIVKGKINKEIADALHISLSTVVTHRRNIMQKLGVRSVSALTVYAMMKGYVDIHQI